MLRVVPDEGEFKLEDEDVKAAPPAIGEPAADSTLAAAAYRGTIAWSHCRVSDVQYQPTRSNYIDVGSQELGDEPIRWHLLLENTHTQCLRFQVALVQPETWLALNETEGELLPGDKPTRLKLNVFPNSIGIHYSHLIIRNLDNPADVTLIQVHMEVVVPGTNSSNPSDKPEVGVVCLFNAFCLFVCFQNEEGGGGGGGGGGRKEEEKSKWMQYKISG